MIRSVADKKYFIEADARARQVNTQSLKRNIFQAIKDRIWRFHLLLRNFEYYRNKRKNVFEKAYYHFLRYWFHSLSLRLGFSIPPNVCGPGLFLPHYGTIIINSNVKIGANCLIHASVNIGSTGGSSVAPQIGDNVFIGPGAKIYGEIEIASNCYIGANAVVNKTFAEEYSVLVGLPARAIKTDVLVWWEKNKLNLNPN